MRAKNTHAVAMNHFPNMTADEAGIEYVIFPGVLRRIAVSLDKNHLDWAKALHV